MKFLNKLFHFDDKKTSLKSEIIGGLMTFVAMCYVLPVVASNLSTGASMNEQGVFVVTAFLTAIICIIMGLVANYPIGLSAGMGLNAYVAFTMTKSFPSWEQRMILVTVCGLLFLILSFTPVRKWIINSIPKDLKAIISAALGGFLLFVGAKGAGIIGDDPSTLVRLGNFADPGVIIAVISIFVVIGLSFCKNTILRTLAIPMGIVFAAVAGLTASIIMTNTGALSTNLEGEWVYQFGKLEGTVTTLPIAPWLLKDLSFANLKPAGDVIFFGLLRDSYGGKEFGADLASVFSNPISYVAIFSIVFVNIFDTTATYISVNNELNILDENGKIKNYRRTVVADSVGSFLAGPFGTSTIEPLAESNIGIATGARTGLAAIVTGLVFALAALIYPVFSIFTANCVTAPALVGIGLVILISSISQLDLRKPEIIVISMVTLLLSVLCYSISDGIGFGLIAYCIIHIVQGKAKQISVPIYIITGLFVIAFIAEAAMNAFV